MLTNPSSGGHKDETGYEVLRCLYKSSRYLNEVIETDGHGEFANMAKVFLPKIYEINQPRRRERTGYGCFGKEFDSGFDTFLTAPRLPCGARSWVSNPSHTMNERIIRGLKAGKESTEMAKT
jgi:hypothetical protein